jgi:hypothetical protein
VTRRTFAATLLTTTLALAAGTARAQSKEDVAFADALFRQGVALLKAGDDAGACARFAQSKELAPAVGVSLYLADCLQRVGKPASAWREFRSAEVLATERKDKRAALAHRRAEALAPTLERITIQVAASLEDSLRISLDGKAVAPEDWGSAIPVDPGNHLVVARSGQAERVFEAFVDATRTTASVTIDKIVDARPAAAAASPVPPRGDGIKATANANGARSPDESTEGPTADPARFWVSIGLVGLGAVGIGIGTGFGLEAKNARDQSNAGPCNASDHCTAHGLSLRNDAIADARISTVAFALGAVAIGASVVVIVIPHGAKRDAVTVTPVALSGGGGALVGTTF